MSLFERKQHASEDIASVTPPMGYVIHEVLGEGAEGRVYRATDNFFAREVVLKPLEVGRGHHNVESIQRSMALANLINSEYVNPAIAAIVQDKHIWLVGGFTEGTSLRDLLKNSSVDDESLFFVISDVVAGLDAIHSVGVVHNDLSPRNLIVGPQGTTKITDFGASARLGDPCPGAGTPGYIAPEKVGGQPSTYALDSFSLGALIVRLLGGELVETDSGRHFPLPIIDHQPTRLRKELARLAHDLMVDDPDARPGTTSILHSLQTISRVIEPGSRERLGDLVRSQMAQKSSASRQKLEDQLKIPGFWQRNRAALIGAGMALATFITIALLLLNPRLPAIQPTTLQSDVRAPLPSKLSLSWLDTQLTSGTQDLWRSWPFFSSQVLQLSIKCSDDFCQLSLSHQSGDQVPHIHLASIADFSIQDLSVWHSTLNELVYQATLR